ncbi:hypothetical protein Hanom_Chr11g01054341 [Helianthus anomalus]
MFGSKFCDLTHHDVRLWFNVFTFRSKFCELIRRNVRACVGERLYIVYFFPFDRFNIMCGS